MISKTGAVALLFCCLGSAAEEAPAWLKPLAGVNLPQYGAKVNAVVLLNEESTVATENGKLTTTTRTAVKFLARQGVDAIFYDQYDSGSGKVIDFRAWMIAPSGKVKKYGKDEILDVACVDNDVYNECRKRAVSGKRDAETGAIFAYESVVERQVFSNQVSFHFQDSAPVRLARFSVTIPAGWELKSASFNGAPPQSAPSGGAYAWQMENLPAMEPEPLSPSVSTIAPWVGVTLLGRERSLPSWVEAARLLAKLNQGVDEPGEAATAKAKALVAGAATELDKIRAIGRFTQQINYVSIQVNVSTGGGYQPHAAPLVFQKLYGDCKDKANLTRAMLKAVGITAYPVALFAGDRTHVAEEWPSFGMFNHAISAIRVGPETQAPAVLDDPRMGRLLFFDSTDPYTPPGLLPEDEQASLALVAAGDAGGLVRLPAARASASARDRKVDATLAADGSLTGSFVDTRTGEAFAPALAVYRGNSKSDYVGLIERWIARGVPGATTTGIDAAENGGAFVLKAQFASQRYAQMPQAGMLILRASPLPHAESTGLTERTRKYPVLMDADALQETVRIALPAGFHVDEKPDPVRLSSPFGSYEAEWAAEAGALVFRRKLEVPAQSVPAAQYGDLRKFLDAVNGSAQMPVVLTR